MEENGVPPPAETLLLDMDELYHIQLYQVYLVTDWKRTQIMCGDRQRLHLYKLVELPFVLVHDNPLHILRTSETIKWQISNKQKVMSSCEI